MHELQVELSQDNIKDVSEKLRYRLRLPSNSSGTPVIILQYAYVYYKPEFAARPFVTPPDSIGQTGDLWMDVDDMQLYYKRSTWHKISSERVVMHPVFADLTLVYDTLSDSLSWHIYDDIRWVPLPHYVELKEFTQWPLYTRVMKRWTSASSKHVVLPSVPISHASIGCLSLARSQVTLRPTNGQSDAVPNEDSPNTEFPSTAPSAAAYKMCSEPITRDPDFWLTDGSLIIRIDNKDFRLHGSKLKRQSSFFAGLVSGQSRDESNTIVSGEVEATKSGLIDGCTVWSLQGVSVGDFRALIASLEDGM